ncbi:putative pentatricopeptide repeat-containing protein At5g40405 [Curcuma longa]|uniref:putative pentatricopeptide repeat-containing protein At5g40405 n=1 Tax=Curcuma longa TaxID=136217 RepID=UPI003D9F3AB7
MKLSLRNIIARHNPIALLDSSSASASASACNPTATSLGQVLQIHGQLLVNGRLHDPVLFDQFVAAVALAAGTASPFLLQYSHRLLDHSPHSTSVFLLNSLIRAHARGPDPGHAFHFYRRLLCSLSPDRYTFTFLVGACIKAAASPFSAASVHAAAIRHGFASDPHVHSALLRMYAEFGDLEAALKVYSEVHDADTVARTAMLGVLAAAGEIDRARELFDDMPSRDPIAWNAMIAGYSQVGRSRDALQLFSSMQLEGMRVSEATLVSVLTACGHLGALDQGKWVHSYLQRNRLRITVTLGTALVDMYSKCGDMEWAMEVFWRMQEKNVYTWSSAMSGLAMNGAGKECIKLFDQMKEQGLLPNGVTFISVLRGCSVAGLVEEGRQHFDSMREKYGINPWREHYGCMVDLYGRAGLLDDAVNFIKKMPIEPHAGAWGALLNACRIHRNIELGEYAMKKLVEVESRNDAAYVLMSNMYAESRNWEGVNDVRESMKGKGVRKEPGCSVMEVGGEVHEFFVGGKSHPRYKEIALMLQEISRKLRLAGYTAKTNEVMFNIEEEEKEDALRLHSEKLAIAFGLIALDEGTCIRIVKNLRVCWDCHDTSKLISRVFQREIILRDRNRFHHFKDGNCSCKDFW